MDIRKVKKLIELLDESGIAEIEITEGEESVRISRHSSSVPSAPAPQPIVAPAPPPPPVAAATSGPRLRVPCGPILVAPVVPLAKMAESVDPRPRRDPRSDQDFHVPCAAQMAPFRQHTIEDVT